MLDYSKVTQLFKKEFPSITQDEIDYLISILPLNVPYPSVKALVRVTKIIWQTKQNVQQNVETE